eukprot:TRINITY_DN448_c0_g1_i6.p1 TRINITY_DN448_c0_g1~~TRINITY_DN448_c0_g1_i6.p1  ORF type:complete len:217 (-),score=81.76 TRINITY_DN448_c0_g1_i6:320-970(-)
MYIAKMKTGFTTKQPQKTMPLKSSPTSYKSLPGEQDQEKKQADLSKEKIKEVWNIFDFNGNGMLSLAEIDKACLDLMPQYYKKKAVLLRAYKAADMSGDGYIQFKEFENLIRLLSEFDKLFGMFQSIDVGIDQRIDFNEFKKGYGILGLAEANESEMKRMFDEMDSNKGGQVLFDEFCMYIAKMKTGFTTKQPQKTMPLKSSPTSYKSLPGERIHY